MTLVHLELSNEEAESISRSSEINALISMIGSAESEFKRGEAFQRLKDRWDELDPILMKIKKEVNR